MYSKNDYRYYLENQLMHSDDFLAHYGVKGMKWKNKKGPLEIVRDIPRKVADENAKKISDQATNKVINSANKVSKSIPKKKKNIKSRVSSIRKKYGLYREKPQGKKLKGSNIYVSHS